MPGGAGVRVGRDYRRTAKRLAERLRQLRAEQGWSQTTAAARIGVGVAMLRRLESGAANPSLAILVSVARAFKLPLPRLLKP